MQAPSHSAYKRTERADASGSRAVPGLLSPSVIRGKFDIGVGIRAPRCVSTATCIPGGVYIYTYRVNSTLQTYGLFSGNRWVSTGLLN